MANLLEKILPTKWRSDSRALDKFRAEMEKMKAKNPKRISESLTLRRPFLATMQQDELKMAVELAKNPERPRRDLLYAMYEEPWENDGHTIGETRKAILKVVGSPFGVFNKGSEEIDETATRLLQRKWFEDYRKFHDQALFWGHSLIQFVEMVPSQEKGLPFEFKKVELIDRYHVRPEEGFIVMDTSHDTGIPFRDEKFKKGLWLMECGEEKYLGLLRMATKEYIWKNYARGDWSRHSEKFGMPMLAIKADTTNDKELNELEDMAKNFGNNLWMILKPDDEVDIKEPTFKDSYQIYKELVIMSNQEISKGMSGGTGTSDEKSFVGSAEVHENILNEFTEANKRAQTYHINEELFPFLMEHGYPFEGKEFRYLDYQSNQEEDDPEPSDKRPGSGAGGRPAKKSRASARFTLRMQ